MVGFLVRTIFFIIAFYFIFKVVKGVFAYLRKPADTELKGNKNSRRSKIQINKDDIIEAEFEEVDNKESDNKESDNS